MLTQEPRFHSAVRKAALITTLAATSLFGAAAAQAYQTTNGWVASDYATGFPSGSAGGPIGLVFDGSGNLLVGDAQSADMYKIPPGGGGAAANKLADGYGGAEGLAFDKSGRLYMARGTKHDVVELNPASGEVLRTVVTGLPCPVGLATDPLSGDLFVSNVFCPGGGIYRISGFANGPGVARLYAGRQDADGLTFAPDGTLFAAAGSEIIRISGTNTGNPGSVSDVAAVPKVDGIAYAPDAGGDYLVANRNDGEIDRVDFNGTLTPLLTGGSRGDLVTVGPDHCLYADLADRIIKMGPASGQCTFAAPVQPGLGGVLGERVAKRVVDSAVKASAPKSVKRGSRFTLKLKVSNKSKTAAHTVVVTDKMPRGTKFVSARSIKGVSCKHKKLVVTCRKASLAAKKSFTITLVVRAKRGSTYTNTATVKSNDLDPAPGNNRSKTKTKVKAGNSVLGVQRRGTRLPRTTG
jgi:uncharacterized repeat protein (TIGR01451 family)